MNLTKKNTPTQLHPYLDQINSLYEIYLNVMWLKKNRDKLSTFKTFTAWLYVFYGYLRDVGFNLWTGTKIFKDPPREFTFTARLKRYRNGNDKEKAAMAEFLCDSWLDQGDPDGDHC